MRLPAPFPVILTEVIGIPMSSETRIKVLLKIPARESIATLSAQA
jgi:hypothetical protein